MGHQRRVTDMRDPVRCRCGQIYDMAAVEPYARFADCTCWKAPCCGTDVNDNIWNPGQHAFTKIDKSKLREGPGGKLYLYERHGFVHFV